MNYELAKELEENGFPFLKFKMYYAVNKDNTPVSKEPTGKEGEDYCFVPTLEELVEACGEEFSILGAPKNDVLEELLTLSGRSDIKWSAHATILGKDVFQFGSTPSEAVARLYIALNKK